MKSSRISRITRINIIWYVDPHYVDIKGGVPIHTAEGYGSDKQWYTAIWSEHAGLEGMSKENKRRTYEKLPRRRRPFSIEEEARPEYRRKGYSGAKKISRAKGYSRKRRCWYTLEGQNRFSHSILWL